MRQIHHWAALLFVAAITVHMLRVFFTGAFRKPRELNWVIGVRLLTLGILEGFSGYSLPDDLLSGTGPADRLQASCWRSRWSAPSCRFFLFGGEFPGNDVHPAALHGPHPADARPSSWP